FACGAFDPGSLLLVYGSTLSTLFTVDTFKTLSGFLIGPSVIKGTYRLGGASSSGGRYLDWVKKLLDIETAPSLDDVSKPSGLLMLPFLDGARIPYQDPEYRVLWYGMNSATTKQDLWKAAMESMGCELYALLRRFFLTGKMPTYAHVTGGLASNTQFLRIVANISGLTLRHFKNVNAAFGDALMALSYASDLEHVRAILDGRRLYPANVEDVEPDQAVFSAYEKKRFQYLAAVESLKKLL
ncbi:MAG TPA: FGGY-family carbohydrate kinase, partial [Rectinemataceae bacterium]|nr:FGGY-family carbohydrate kinase [Rectinemataceae bacterium]